MLDYVYCLLCRSVQLGGCRTPDDAAQCPMWKVEPEEREGQGIESKRKES